MSRQLPVGSAEMAVLRGLSDNGGRWTPGDGVLWESRHWTEQVLCSLARKGLVDEVVSEKRYELTEAGRELALSWGFPQAIPNSERRTVHWPTPGEPRVVNIPARRTGR